MFSMRVSRLVSSLHLYAGLFLAPFVILFAVSVFLVNHFPVRPQLAESRREVTGLDVPAGVASLEGRARIQKLRPLLDRLNVRGEAGFIRHLPEEQRLTIPVSTPSSEAVVDLHLREKTAVIISRKTGLWRASVYLHKMPGPHLVNIKGNWVWTRIWGVFADATVYLIFLTTATGIWLWWLLRPERRAGLLWLAAGAAVFLGVVCALSI